MKITTKNYFKTIDEVGVDNLPEALKKSHTIIGEKTNNGKDWGIYEIDAEVKRVFELTFEKLQEFIDNKGNLSGFENTNETMTEESPMATKFIKRFLLLNGKTYQKKEIEGFLNDVQNAIEEKEKTMDSAILKVILLIQSKLLATANNMGKSIKIELSAETKKRLQFALNRKKAKPVVSKPKKENLSGVEEVQEVKPSQKLMNSIDFTNLHFNTIGFTDKWLNLIGDPSPGFTAMVFGKPKMGKSYLCVDFAGYLARNHGTILYVANEEKLDATLQMKLNDKNVKHENLFVSDYLPEDLSKYKFVILDSVNKLGLSPQDLENLKKKNPSISFIFIFQTTKDGKFRGANSYQHDVDVVIEVPEKGKAVQFGRFNQGGEISIFDSNSSDVKGLEGVKKSKKNLEVSKNVSNVASMKKKANIIKDWTEPTHLNSSDKRDLKLVKKYYDEGNLKQAMNYASRLETIVREEIPPKIWQEMGGELTKAGKERLMTKDYENRADDINPRFIFSTTSTALLVEALRGDFDLKQLLRRELANRGLNTEGDWVGFDKAAIIHKIK